MQIENFKNFVHLKEVHLRVGDLTGECVALLN